MIQGRGVGRVRCGVEMDVDSSLHVLGVGRVLGDSPPSKQRNMGGRDKTTNNRSLLVAISDRQRKYTVI